MFCEGDGFGGGAEVDGFEELDDQRNGLLRAKFLGLFGEVLGDLGDRVCVVCSDHAGVVVAAETERQGGEINLFGDGD